MSKIKPKWEQLEIIVTDIQKQLAPDAEVRHDHRVMGKSGRQRKLDVTISQKISTFPIFIVFDCKHHSKYVKLEDVEAFAMQLRDVDASLGVMISSSGFDDGAKAIAKQNNIILQTFRKAEETDWKELIGENAWSALIKVEMPQVKAIATMSGNQVQIEIPFDAPLYDEKGEILNTLKNNFWEMWKQIGQPISEFNGKITFEGFTSYFKNGNDLLPIESVTLNAKLIAKKYLVNVNMAQGSVIEDENNTPVYRSVASKGYDWAEIINNQPGIEISNDEYQQMMRESKLTTELSGAKRYIRIVAEDKGIK